MDNDLKKFLLTKISKLKLNTNDVPDLFKLAAKKFPAPAENILQIMADCFYEQGEHANCLTTLEYYAQETGEILLEVILARYSQHIAEHKKNYEHNVALLKSYPWCFNKDFPEFACLEKLLLFYDHRVRVALELKNVAIDYLEQDILSTPEHTGICIFLLIDIVSINNLIKLEQQISNESEYLNQGGNNPIYLYYDNVEAFYLLLMQDNLENLLQKERLVFFLGNSEMEQFLYDDYSIIPNTFLAEPGKEILIKKIHSIVEEIAFVRRTQFDKNIQVNKEYYRKNKELILKNIRDKKPRIFFVTTRFSTAIQYHTRDCMEACKKLGCAVTLVMEPSNIHRNYLSMYSKVLRDFHPDIFFQIDYFANRKIVPQEILGVNWIQDPLPHLTDEKTPLILGKNDYIITLDKKNLKNSGYAQIKALEGRIPANHLIYKPYQITTLEKEKYSADIILVANNNDFKKIVMEIVGILNKVQKLENCDKIIEGIIWSYYQSVYEEKINLTSIKSAEKYLAKEIKTYCHVELEADILSDLGEEFFNYSKAVAFRSVLAEWLIDGGYTNLKLYGNDWGDNPKFAPYAMGVAPNGEILSKIYQSAKIVLGTNPHNTAPARLYETFLSGGFYIANYIAPEYDTMNIRDKYIENEEIPFFYNRQDLYAKLDYFLANPAECQKITERTRTKMLENDTYEALMKRMLDWLAKKV